MSIDKRVLTGLALGAAVSLLAGCVDKSNPDMVDKRSVERWNFLIAHQAEKAYDYLTPGYRATQTRENYATAMNNRPVQWTSAAFKRKTCDGDRCNVDLDIGYAIRMPGTGVGTTKSSSTQSETWIRVNGEWYFLPK